MRATTRRTTELDASDYGFWSVEEYEAWEREWHPEWSEPMGEEVSVLQTFEGCTLVYDLTAHKIVVTAQDGSELLMLQPLPDNPGGFDLTNDGQSIAVHNPGGVDFVGVHDMYEDNKAIFG